jgi:hypothetical protein
MKVIYLLEQSRPHHWGKNKADTLGSSLAAAHTGSKGERERRAALLTRRLVEVRSGAVAR